MKAWILTMLLALSFSIVHSQEQYSPFLKVNELSGPITNFVENVTKSLEEANFQIIGQYHPAGNEDLFVLAYTSEALKNLSLQFPDRGALGATLKIGFVEKDGITTISMLNPIYMFYAYWLEDNDAHQNEFIKISDQAINAMKNVGSMMIPFGGAQTQKELIKYRYKILMPYFTDPVELNQFSSFEEGLRVIRQNLENRKGGTEKVYEQVFEDKKIAVFGVALLDPDKGEMSFLPKIGEDHIAAMPYDLILQGNEATILHGKFRFALYWPELTMGTFMKIMSTPGNVKDVMEDLTK